MKISDIRIYPTCTGDEFQIILRVRGGIMKHGTYPTLQSALECAWALEGRKKGQPVYVYEASFASLFADAVAPAVADLLGAQ